MKHYTTPADVSPEDIVQEIVDDLIRNLRVLEVANARQLLPHKRNLEDCRERFNDVLRKLSLRLVHEDVSA